MKIFCTEGEKFRIIIALRDSGTCPFEDIKEMCSKERCNECWNAEIEWVITDDKKDNKNYGWELYAVECHCPRDEWSSGLDAIPGTWNEEKGSWYELRYRCSKCKSENDKQTLYCPSCGTRMNFIQRMREEPT